MCAVIIFVLAAVFLFGTFMGDVVWGPGQSCLESWGPRWAFQKTCSHPKHRLAIEHGIVVCRCER